MSLGLKRSDLQSLAAGKLEDAKLLLVHRRFANAYYLAGYAVELGLKACIAKQIVAETIPEKAFVLKTYTHALRDLISLAGLTSALKVQEHASAAFAANWAIVAEWGPEDRYVATDAYSAQLLLAAIDDAQDGVLPWIRTYW